MRRVREETGACLFSGKDVLSPQQVAGFFSRIAMKIRKTSSIQNEERESEDEKQESAIEAEALQSHLHYPINALSRNICNLAHTKPYLPYRLLCRGTFVVLAQTQMTSRGKGKSHLQVVLRNPLETNHLKKCLKKHFYAGTWLNTNESISLF